MPQSKKQETDAQRKASASRQGSQSRFREGKAPNFEQKLQRLEELSSSLKEGDLPLEEAVKKFEEGVLLAKALEKELSRIERRIEILVNNPEADEDKPEFELFPELGGDED